MTRFWHWFWRGFVAVFLTCDLLCDRRGWPTLCHTWRPHHRWARVLARCGWVGFVLWFDPHFFKDDTPTVASNVRRQV